LVGDRSRSQLPKEAGIDKYESTSKSEKIEQIQVWGSEWKKYHQWSGRARKRKEVEGEEMGLL